MKHLLLINQMMIRTKPIHLQTDSERFIHYVYQMMTYRTDGGIIGKYYLGDYQSLLKKYGYKNDEQAYNDLSQYKGKEAKIEALRRNFK